MARDAAQRKHVLVVNAAPVFLDLAREGRGGTRPAKQGATGWWRPARSAWRGSNGHGTRT